MPVLRWFCSLWRNVVCRDRVDRDLDEEIRTAFESLVDERIRVGARPEEARRAATLEFGAVEGVKERVRDARAGARFDTWWGDVRYAVRLLRRNPVFTLIATLSLAIGIGANTTIVTVANALLFRAPAGVSEPDRLLDIFRAQEGKTLGNFTTSYPYYLDVRQRTTTLAGVFAYEFERERSAWEPLTGPSSRSRISSPPTTSRPWVSGRPLDGSSHLMMTPRLAAVHSSY